MKKHNLSIKIVLINTLILMSTNAQDLNRIGVIHQNLPTFKDANVRAFSASAFHESIAKEIATIDTVDQFEIVSYEQISAAIRTQSRDISCDNLDCVKNSAVQAKLNKTIVLDLGEVKFSRTSDLSAVRVSGDVKMSLIKVEGGRELSSSQTIVLMLTEKEVQPKIRGSLVELNQVLGSTTWTLFDLAPPADRFTSLPQQSSTDATDDPTSKTSIPIIYIAAAVASVLVLVGLVALLSGPGAPGHTYPPDFPEIP